MLRRTWMGLGLAVSALISASCNGIITGGDNACPPSMPNCDPNNPGGNNPETVVGLGPGGGVGGMPGTPFDPKGNGSSGVATDPNGNVILDPTTGNSSAQSVIWVANSGEGTVSKIDTRTKKQLAKYQTYPGGNADPSRTTVSLGGDIVVANRAWPAFTGNSNIRFASAVKIAGDKGNCQDRNKNGVIDTYEGTGPVPAAFQWTNANMPSPDECVLWKTQLDTDPSGVPVTTAAYPDGTRPRAAGWDGEITDTSLSQYVYIGLFDTKEVIRLDGVTGAIVKRISVAPTAPYGLALDKNGSVWVMGRETSTGSLTKIDVKNATTPDKVTTYTPTQANCNYGITVDPRGYVYTAFNTCLMRFDPTTAKFEYLTIPGSSQLRGVGIDNQYNLWVGDSNVGAHHVDVSAAPPAAGASTMVFKKNVSVVGAWPGTYAGIAIDFDNKPWVVSYAGTNSHAIQVDPNNNYSTFVYNTPTTTADGTLNNSYTYSDMSGYQLRNASRAGTFRNIFNGCTDGNTTWTNLTYNVTAPRGTKVSIRYRGASTVAGLTASPWTAATGTSPVPIMLTVPGGATPRYLQVEVTMTSVDANLTPVLSALSAGFTCSIANG